MEVINCPRCGKLFTKINNKICDNCVKEEEDLFQKVRAYIDDHKHCSIHEVVAETGATPNKIMKYLREGRIEISEGMAGEGALNCEKCGRPIRRGHYCDKCVINLNQEVVGIYEEDERRRNSGPKMHTKRD